MHHPLSVRIPETNRLDFRLSPTQPVVPGASDVQARYDGSPRDLMEQIPTFWRYALSTLRGPEEAQPKGVGLYRGL
jgi:hypothetical protein